MEDSTIKKMDKSESPLLSTFFIIEEKKHGERNTITSSWLLVEQESLLCTKSFNTLLNINFKTPRI